ncbi:hypothetical protein DL98DRAFT_515624 [Cadophora sp. DSE1049]|nr:hypothetical protein DL98DRAFT_515624 [Cadophora sp. DSE1049]
MSKATRKMAQPKQTYRDVRVGSMNSLQLSNAQSSGNEPRISLMETIPLATTIDSDDTGPDVSPTSTSTTIAFPLFAKLATEIQDLIWEHASHTTRVVKIEASTLNTYHSHSLAFRTDFTPTGLLTACRGSRAAIKKMPRISVTLIKQQNLNSFGYTNFYPGKTIQINPDLDIILLWNSLKSPSIGNVLTPWLSAIANKSQSTQHPHPAAQGFSGVKNLAFCLSATILWIGPTRLCQETLCHSHSLHRQHPRRFKHPRCPSYSVWQRYDLAV